MATYTLNKHMSYDHMCFVIYDAIQKEKKCKQKYITLYDIYKNQKIDVIINSWKRWTTTKLYW